MLYDVRCECACEYDVPLFRLSQNGIIFGDNVIIGYFAYYYNVKCDTFINIRVRMVYSSFMKFSERFAADARTYIVPDGRG